MHDEQVIYEAIRSIAKTDVIGKYAESLKSKVIDARNEFLKYHGEETEPYENTIFHLQAIEIITDDILRLTATALNNVDTQSEPKSKKIK